MVNKVISGFFIFAFFTLIGMSCKTNTDCVCPEYYHPVCGDNGKTYENECLADCDNVGWYDGTCAIDGIGLVKFGGDSLCGFLISTLDQDFKPDTLQLEFAVENLWVFIKYRKLNQYYTCDQPYGNYQVIQLIEISKVGNK